MPICSNRRLICFGVALGALAFATGHPTALRAAASGGTSAIEVHHPWARAGLQGRNSAAYMRLYNRGDASDRLVGVASDVAEKTELHETVMEGDRMKVRPLDGIEVPAGGHAALEPGGRHVMLVRLRHRLAEGDSFPLRLTFERAGTVEVTVEVRKAGALSQGHGHDGGMQQGGHAHGDGHD